MDEFLTVAEAAKQLDRSPIGSVKNQELTALSNEHGSWCFCKEHRKRCSLGKRKRIFL